MLSTRDFVEQELAASKQRRQDLRKLQFRLADSGQDESLEAVFSLERHVVRVDEWMSLLTPEQRFVVRERLIAGHSWSHVTYEYSKMFETGETIPDDTIMRHLENGLQCIVDFATDENDDAEW